MVTACLVANVGIKTGGFPQRLSDAAQALLDVGRNPAQAQLQWCIPGSARKPEGLPGLEQCDVGATSARNKTFLIWATHTRNPSHPP